MTVGQKTRLSLQTKAVLGLLTVAVLPLCVSAILVGQIADVAQNVAHAGEARLMAPLERAKHAYREAVSARKESFRQAAVAIARDPGLVSACGAPSTAMARGESALRAILAAQPSLARAALHVAGAVVASAEGPRREEPTRELELTQPVGTACEVRLVFSTGAKLLEDFEALNAAVAEHRRIERIRQGLPQSYRVAFLALVGLVVFGTTGVAIWISRRAAKKIESLVGATHRVGEGDLSVRVELSGQDELTTLGESFNQMVTDLQRSRARIEYLEKIGAWQEVAERLAHEIKNPLTPIQLAMQELHKKYDGTDLRYRKTLDDAHAIVTEEIAGLRRLVDTFRGFAKLPHVEPVPLDVAVVVEDVAREHPIEIVAPARPVTALCDRLLLRRALANLVENALQAGATRVEVRWDTQGGLARVRVEDDGPGVPKDIRARVFDPYVTTKEHGTGLGLAIVKKTLLEHGGDAILSEEPSPLGGARFELSVPTQPVV
jgi:nitrogen fixation/metabolism regulation signal transduction histidine kinase